MAAIENIILFSVPTLTVICLVTDFISLLVFITLRQLFIRFWFIMQTIFQILSMIVCINYTLELHFNYPLALMSDLHCSILRYLEINLGSIATWILMYINIQRVLQVHWSKGSWKKAWVQSIVVFIVILANSIVFSPIIFELKVLSHSTYLGNGNLKKISFFENFELTLVLTFYRNIQSNKQNRRSSQILWLPN